MRTWIKSACVVLAWSILPVTLVAIGMQGSVHPAQANTRTVSSTEVILISTLSVAATPATATSHTTKYVVQDGDTLSGIAARFAVRGGWPALYAANRQVIGPDPNVIHAGSVLMLPGQVTLVRYTVAAGDSLSGIAARFAVRGGWPALYAANRQVVGPDPSVIHAGTVLTLPHAAAPSPPPPNRVHRRQRPPTPRPSPRPSPRLHPLPPAKRASAAAGMPAWLKIMLLAVGLLILAALVAGPVLVLRRRRGRGGRSRSVASAVRRVAAAARVHPVGVAVPSAVLATGIVLFTFVTSATVRVPPAGGSGPGSVAAAGPGAGQPQHGLRSRQPGPPALPGSPGQNARSLAGGAGQIAPLPPVPAAVPPAGPGRGPRASRDPSSRLPGGGLVCDAGQVPSSAATAGAGSGGAGR